MESLEKKTQKVDWKQWIPGLGLLFALCSDTDKPTMYDLDKSNLSTGVYNAYQLLSGVAIASAPLIMHIYLK